MEIRNYNEEKEYFKKHFEYYNNSTFYISDGRLFFINAFPYMVKKFKFYKESNVYNIHVGSHVMFINKKGDDPHTLEMCEPLEVDKNICEIIKRNNGEILVINALLDEKFDEKNLNRSVYFIER